MYTDKKDNKSHIIKNSSNSANKIIQRYLPVQGTDYVQSAAMQIGNALPQRYIAVNKREPATVYFHGVVPQSMRLALDRLGMGRTGMQTINNTNYNRYKQIYKQLIPIPPLQQLQVLQYPQQLQPLRQLQPNRTDIERIKANNILQTQLFFLQRLQQISQNVRAGGNFNQHQVDLNLHIDFFYRAGIRTSRATKALGSDILHAAFALLRYIQMQQPVVGIPVPLQIPVHHPPMGGVEEALRPLLPTSQNLAPFPDPAPNVNEPIYNIQNDGITLLDMIDEEINTRIAQVTAEQVQVQYKPFIRTGCGAASFDLSKTMQDNTALQLSTIFEHSRLRFRDSIGWNYHVASDVSDAARALTTDRLIFEDAVGKSSNEGERANAHWFAHLYGNDETVGEPQIALPHGVATLINSNRWTVVPSRCRFNNVDHNFRRDFFAVRGLRPNDSWYLRAITSIAAVSVAGAGARAGAGIMKVRITNRNRVEYRFRMANAATLDVGLIDFVRTTADAVMDDMLMQEMAVQAHHRKSNVVPSLRDNDIKGLRQAYIGNHNVEYIEDI